MKKTGQGVSVYINGEKIANATSQEITCTEKGSFWHEPNEFEFYLKRKACFYFRNDWGDKFIVETNDKDQLELLCELKYGDYIKAIHKL